MGASKGGGYTKKTAVTGEQKSFLDQLLAQANPNLQQAAQGFSQFLPGGGGGEAIAKAAQNRFQQQTVPSILNAYGSNNKGSSALNQALAAGASNLNTDIASQLAQMQLQASQGLGNLGVQQGQLGSKDQFAYLQRQMPFWQSALLAGISGGSEIGKSLIGG
jgi:hypothetical protein